MIELINVSKNYGDFQAVKQLNLKIDSGRIHGFLGPNGAGKTTTIRMLSGILPPSSGEIRIAGLSYLDHPEQIKARTGYVPDRPSIYEKLKAFEYLIFICDLYSLPKDSVLKRADKLLELFRLQDCKNRMIEDFSHGMKQKLVIISALLPDPDVLIIDEPMVGLDPKGAATLKKLLRELAESGKTIFLSTHTMSVAQELCDSISIINNGEIRATGTMQELRQYSSHEGNLEEIFLQITEAEDLETNRVL